MSIRERIDAVRKSFAGTYAEVIEGPSSSGAAYMVALPRDESWNPVCMADATQIEVTEYDEAGKEIRRLYVERKVDVGKTDTKSSI